jgi:hypothetical protein
MSNPREEQYPDLRCRKCEGKLSEPVVVAPEKYGLVPNRHGAIIRRCTECFQLWLGYVVELPNHKIKIILKMIDKSL